MWPLLHSVNTNIFKQIPRHVTVTYRSNNVRCQSNSRVGKKFYEKRRNILAYGSAALLGIFSVWWVKRDVGAKSKDKKALTIIDKDFGKFVKFKGYVLPDQIFKLVPQIQDFKIRPDDVFVISFPKSGTTWVQEIVYLLMTDGDFASAERKKIEDRFPFLEFPCPGLDIVNAMESPRLIKTHLPRRLLPKEVEEKQPKIIYIARNPRDVTVSYFHFCKTITFLSFQGDFTQFFDKFLKNEVPYAPWCDHVKEFYDYKEKGHVLFITYEELHKDIIGSIRKIAKFLQREISNENLLRIAVFCSFKNMKDNKMSNYSWLEEMGLKGNGEAFMRKGKVGDWKNYYSSEMCSRMDEMTESKLGREGLTFVYDDSN